jgi:hypothetical protein
LNVLSARLLKAYATVQCGMPIRFLHGGRMEIEPDKTTVRKACAISRVVTPRGSRSPWCGQCRTARPDAAGGRGRAIRPARVAQQQPSWRGCWVNCVNRCNGPSIPGMNGELARHSAS